MYTQAHIAAYSLYVQATSCARSGLPCGIDAWVATVGVAALHLEMLVAKNRSLNLLVNMTFRILEHHVFKSHLLHQSLGVGGSEQPDMAIATNLGLRNSQTDNKDAPRMIAF